MRLREALLIGYFVVCAAMLVWPGYAMLGNHLRPALLGLPLSFAWNVGWVVLTFVALVAYYLTGEETE
jgi:hypothetical protein